MSELTEFLLARIAEDEAVARAYSNGNWTGNPYAGDGDGSDLRYAERFGPARVLAECEAKRRILLAHMPTGTELVGTMDDLMGTNYEDADEFERIVSREEICMTCAGYPTAPCGTLLALVLPYADHPDFRPEWSVR